MSAYHESPLGRGADATWRSFVSIAYKSGIEKRYIAEASLRRSPLLLGDPTDSSELEQQVWEELVNDDDQTIAEVASYALELVKNQSEFLKQLDIRDSIS